MIKGWGYLGKVSNCAEQSTNNAMTHEEALEPLNVQTFGHDNRPQPGPCLLNSVFLIV